MKPTTRERFQTLHAARPNITVTEMADALKVTRQRASALAQQLGVQLGGREAEAVRPCRYCGKPLDRHAKAYHAACYLKRHTVRLTCRGCKRTFTRTLRERNRHPGAGAFHNRECFHAYRAKAGAR